MFRFSHFVAPAVLGASLAIGGCAAERHDDIPLTAAQVDEGRESVTYTAPHDGRVYVYNRNSGEMLYNGQLRKGQTVRVDAEENKILVDNQTAVERDLVNDHRFKIFFDRDEDAATASQVIVPPAQTTVVTPPAARTTVTTDPNAPHVSGSVTADPNAPRTSGSVTADPNAPRTNVTVDPNAPRTNVTVDPNAPRTTIQTGPDAKTTVTTPDAKITTDPQSGSTTVQPR